MKRKSLKDEILHTAKNSGLSAHASPEYKPGNHYEVEICGYFRTSAKDAYAELDSVHLEEIFFANRNIGRPYVHFRHSGALRYGRDKDGTPHHKGVDHIVERVDVWINYNLTELRKWEKYGNVPDSMHKVEHRK